MSSGIVLSLFADKDLQRIQTLGILNIILTDNMHHDFNFHYFNCDVNAKKSQMSETCFCFICFLYVPGSTMKSEH